MQIHLPSAFGTWGGTSNSSQYSPSAIWSTWASWLKCLSGITSSSWHPNFYLLSKFLFCHVSLHLADGHKTRGLCRCMLLRVCCKSQWAWYKGLLGQGRLWPLQLLCIIWQSRARVRYSPELLLFSSQGCPELPWIVFCNFIPWSDWAKPWTGSGLCSKQCCSGPACWKNKCNRSKGMLLVCVYRKILFYLPMTGDIWVVSGGDEA